MLRQWYISVDGRQSGPFPQNELQRMALDGRLHATTHIWSEGLPGWVAAESVPGLFPPVAIRPPSAARLPPPLPNRPFAPPAADDPLAFLGDVNTVNPLQGDTPLIHAGREPCLPIDLQAHTACFARKGKQYRIHVDQQHLTITAADGAAFRIARERVHSELSITARGLKTRGAGMQAVKLRFTPHASLPVKVARLRAWAEDLHGAEAADSVQDFLMRQALLPASMIVSLQFVITLLVGLLVIVANKREPITTAVFGGSALLSALAFFGIVIMHHGWGVILAIGLNGLGLFETLIELCMHGQHLTGPGWGFYLFRIGVLTSFLGSYVQAYGKYAAAKQGLLKP